MPSNQTRKQLLERIKTSTFPGSIIDVFKAADQGIDLISQFEQEQQQQQQQGMQVANTPEQQEVGLRDQHAMGNTDASMAFPNVEPNQSFNTMGMKAPIDIQKIDDQGHLVESYKNVPPGIQNLPTGPYKGTIIESPAAYQTGGLKKLFRTKKQRKIDEANEEILNDDKMYSAGVLPTININAPGDSPGWTSEYDHDEAFSIATSNPTSDIAKHYKSEGDKGRKVVQDAQGNFIKSVSSLKAPTLDELKRSIRVPTAIQTADAVGMTGIPILSEAGDLVSAGLSYAKGNYTDAGLSMAGIFAPLAGGAAFKGSKNIMRKSWHNNPNPNSLLESRKVSDNVITQGRKDIEGFVTNNPNKIPVSKINKSSIKPLGDVGELGPYKNKSGRHLVEVDIGDGTKVPMYRSSSMAGKTLTDPKSGKIVSSQGFYSPYLGSMDGTLNTRRGSSFVPGWQIKTTGWDKGYGSQYIENLGHKLKSIDIAETADEINKIQRTDGPIINPIIHNKKGGLRQYQNGGEMQLVPRNEDVTGPFDKLPSNLDFNLDFECLTGKGKSCKDKAGTPFQIGPIAGLSLNKGLNYSTYDSDGNFVSSPNVRANLGARMRYDLGYKDRNWNPVALSLGYNRNQKLITDGQPGGNSTNNLFAKLGRYQEHRPATNDWSSGDPKYNYGLTANYDLTNKQLNRIGVYGQHGIISGSASINPSTGKPYFSLGLQRSFKKGGVKKLKKRKPRMY